MNTTIVDPEQIKGFLKAIEKGEITEKDLEEIKSVRKLFDNLAELVGEEEKVEVELLALIQLSLLVITLLETIVDIAGPEKLNGQ